MVLCFTSPEASCLYFEIFGFVFCLLLDHQLPEVSLVQDLGQTAPWSLVLPQP